MVAICVEKKKHWFTAVLTAKYDLNSVLKMITYDET